MIDVTVIGSWSRVGLAGEYDIANYDEILPVAEHQAGQGVTDLTVDLSLMLSLGVARLNALVAVSRLFGTAGRRTIIVGAVAAAGSPSPPPGLDQVLPLTSVGRQPEAGAAAALSGGDPLGEVALPDLDLTDRLAEHARLLLSGPSLTDDPRRLTRAAATIVPGATAASLTLRTLN